MRRASKSGQSTADATAKNVPAVRTHNCYNCHMSRTLTFARACTLRVCRGVPHEHHAPRPTLLMLIVRDGAAPLGCQTLDGAQVDGSPVLGRELVGWRTGVVGRLGAQENRAGGALRHDVARVHELLPCG
jgi:hypothetical protein